MFCKQFEIVIVVEKGAAHKDYADWFPYNSCEIWSYDDVNKVYSDDVYAIHVGGGSLPFGYYGHFILSALDAGKKVLMSGIDASIKANGDGLRDSIYERVDFLSVRTKKSYKLLKKSGMNVHHGADLALGLIPSDMKMPKLDVVITMRGFSEPNSDHIRSQRKLDQYFKAKGLKVTYLPFAPEDLDFLKFCSVSDDQILNFWHDPTIVLKAIKDSKFVISIGRLHTLVFAMHLNKPVIAIDPGIVSNGKKIVNRKNQYFCKEMGLEFFENVDGFLGSENIDEIMNTGRSFTNDYLFRFKKMERLLFSELKGGTHER
jgi:polysaccharide pyruvyl transferase WcaK-like protein